MASGQSIMSTVPENLESEYEEAMSESTGSISSPGPVFREDDDPDLFVNGPGADPEYWSRDHTHDEPVEDYEEEDDGEEDMQGPIPTHEEQLSSLAARVTRGETLGPRNWTTLQDGYGWRRNIAEQRVEAGTYQDPSPLGSHLSAVYSARAGVQQHDYAYPGAYGEQLNEVQTHPEQVRLRVPNNNDDDDENSEPPVDPREDHNNEAETSSDDDEVAHDDEVVHDEESESSDDEVVRDEEPESSDDEVEPELLQAYIAHNI